MIGNFVATKKKSLSVNFFIYFRPKMFGKADFTNKSLNVQRTELAASWERLSGQTLPKSHDDEWLATQPGRKVQTTSNCLRGVFSGSLLWRLRPAETVLSSGQQQRGATIQNKSKICEVMIDIQVHEVEEAYLAAQRLRHRIATDDHSLFWDQHIFFCFKNLLMK